MAKYALTLLAAVTLAQPVLSASADKPSDCDAKTSSFVPHPHSSHHVYGAPMQPAIVHQGKISHRHDTPKKRSSSAAKKNHPQHKGPRDGRARGGTSGA
jgi:hypothetical protein